MSIGKDIVDTLQKYVTDRSVLDNHCDEIAKRVIPRYSGTFHQDKDQTKGDKRTEYMVDPTASLALERFASIMESLQTPRGARWHLLRPSDPELAKLREVRIYYDQVTDVLFRHRNSWLANFASQKGETYLSKGAFGTGILFTDALEKQRGFRYKACPLSHTYIATNHQGIVDTVYRKIPLTAKQAVGMFGRENMPDKILTALDKEPLKEFTFIHAVMPREDIDYQRADFKRMPFASYYVCEEEQRVMREGGYNTFPYAISRHVMAPHEAYGRSPAMLALPAIKTLNEEKMTVLKQGHRAVDPVLLMHDDGIVDTFSMKPGAGNAGAVTKEGRPLVHTLPTGQLAVGLEMMEHERATINDAFYVTLFQILTENPQMTATEVLERSQEKGALLSPVVGREQSEAHGPMIEREIDLANQQNLLPPMPEVLREAGAEYSVVYDSPISRSEKAGQAAGYFRSVEAAQVHYQNTGDPSSFDHFNMDVIMPEVMNINAVPEAWKASPEEIAAKRQGRQQQAETRQAIEAAPALAGAAKAVGQ